MKKLYTYTVNKTEKVEQRETKKNGSVVLTYEDKITPVKVAIKKPTRDETDEFQLVYDSEFSKAVIAGVATVDMMRKAYLNAEGLDANVDIENFDSTFRELQKDQLLYQKSIIDGKSPEDLKELEEKIQKSTNFITEFKTREEAFFSRTAESRAKRKTIFWCALNLLYYEVDGKYEAVFQGSNFESKKSFYYEVLEENENSLEEKAFEKGYLLLQSWINSDSMTESDFAMLESIIDDQTVLNAKSAS